MSGATSLDGTSWGAGAAFVGNLGSLDINEIHGASLYAGSTLNLNTVNDMNLAIGALRAVRDVSLSATRGAISTSAGAAQGIQTTAGNLALTAGNGLINAGTMTADTGSVTARINGSLINSGTLHAKTTLDIADQTDGSTENVINSGTLIADGAMIAKAAQFTNQAQGTVQGTTGTILTATQLSNAGTLIASDTTGRSGTFTVTALSNSGTLQSIENLVFNTSGTFSNSGKLLATNDLVIDAGASGLVLSNVGVIQAGNMLTINGNNAIFDTQFGTLLGKSVGMTLASLNNSGTLQSNAGMTLAIANRLTNSGTLLAKTSLSSDSGSLYNSGTLQANQGGDFSVHGSIENTGTVTVSNDVRYNGLLQASTLSNTGTIQSAHDLTIKLDGATLTNAGKLLADNHLMLTATGSKLAITNQSGGYIQAGNAAGKNLIIDGNAVALNNNSGAVVLGNIIDLTLSSLSNDGNLQSEAGMSYAIANGLTNSGTLLAKTTLSGSSASLTNSGTLQANRGATLTARGVLDNTGILIASNEANTSGTLTASTLLNKSTNPNNGIIWSAHDLAIDLSGATLTNAGKLLAANQLTITSTGSPLTIANQSGGYLQAGNSLLINDPTVTLSNSGVLLGKTVNLTLASLTNTGLLQSDAGMTYTIGNDLINSGTLLATTTLKGSSASLTNSGTLQANQGATLTVRGLIDNSGTLIASKEANYSGALNARTLSNSSTNPNNGIIWSAHDLAVNLSGATLTNTGKLLAANQLTITSTGSPLTIANQSGGYLQAGNSLLINDPTVTLNNSGVLLGKTVDLTLASLSNTGILQSDASMTYKIQNNLINSGTFLAQTTLSGSSANLTNSGTLQANQGATLTVNGALNNTGILIASKDAGYSGTLNARTLSNSGTVRSAGDLDIHVSGTTLTNAGKVLADSQLTIAAKDNALTITNQSGGYLQAGDSLTIDSMSAPNVTPNVVLNNSGVLLGKTVALTLSSLVNDGTVQSDADMSYAITNALTNTGTVLAKTTLEGSSASLTNSGTLQANHGATLTADTIDNSGVLIVSNDATNSGTLNARTLLNTSNGIIQSARDLDIKLSGATLINTGKLLTNGNLTVAATGSPLTIANQSNGYLQAGGNLTITNPTVTLRNSGVLLGKTVDLTLASLTNAGLLQSDAGMTYTIENDLINSGTVLAQTTLSGSSARLTNSGTLQANQGATLTVHDDIANTGTLIASKEVGYSGTVHASTLSNSGSVQSAGNLDINLSGTALTNSGKLLASGQLTIAATGSPLTITNQSGGYLQAGNRLLINDPTVTLNNSGVLLGKTVALTLSSLVNDGTVQSDADMSYAITNALTNTNTLLAKTTMIGSSASLKNSGKVQANQGANLTSSTDIDNTGILIASSNSSYGGALHARTLSNKGTIWSAHDLAINLSGTTLDNTGKLLADDHLTITATGNPLTITNQSGGYIQAGNAAADSLTFATTATTPNITLDNNAGATLIGGRLNWNTVQLTNQGTIQGGVGASVINVTNTLTNSGTFTLATTGGSGTITADKILNSGTLQSQGDATLNVATALNNSGQLLSAKGLTVRGTDNAYSISNTDRMQAGGLMKIRGQNEGNAVDVTVGGKGVMLGGSMDMNAGTLTLNDGALVSTSGDMTLALNTLSLGGSNAYIVGSTAGIGTTRITLANGFSNPGAIHSGGILEFSAPWITNSATGGMSALDTLTLTTNGDFLNQGAIYAGKQLNMVVGQTFTNAASASAPQGTLNSDGSMDLSAATFINNSEINAARDITITAATFKNNVGVSGNGDLIRTWTEAIAGPDQANGSVVFYRSSCVCNKEYENYYREWSKQETFGANQPNNFRPQIIGNGTVTIQQFKTGTNKGGLISGKNVNLVGGGSGAIFINDDLALNKETWREDWSIETYWYGVVGYSASKNRGISSHNVGPHTSSVITSTDAGIYATNTLDARTFSLINLGGLPVQGTKPATVTSRSQSGTPSTDLAPDADGTSGVDKARSIESTRGADDAIPRDPTSSAPGALGKDKTSDSNIASAIAPASGADGAFPTDPTSGTPGASATKAASGTTGSSGTSSTSSTKTASGIEGTRGVSTVVGTTTVSGKPAIRFDGLVLALPTNPNGYFVISKTPKSNYLVETNPLFAVGSSYFGGSNYLAERYGYDPALIQKRLGDANYEAYLIRQQLVEQTGRNILVGYESESKQLQSLMDSGADEAKRLKMVWGQALSAEQVANLKHDMVWMVEVEVAGQKVLSPVVYLSQASKDQIQTGAVIAAKDINMDVTGLSNNGGTIQASNSMIILSKNDIRNTGGTISANDMALVSTDGKVINETIVTRYGDLNNYQDIAGPVGVISAKNNLLVSGSQGVDLIGATLSAGTAAVVHSENGAINVQSLALETKKTTVEQSNSFWSSSSKTTVETSQTQLAAGISVGDGKNPNAQLSLLAEKGAVNLTAADLTSSGAINIKANDVNIATLDLKNTKSVSSSSSGISGSGGKLSIGSSSQNNTESQSNAVGSTINAGGALNIQATNDIVLEGGSYNAKTVSLAAGNDVITKAAKDTYSSSANSSSSGFSAGQGNFGGSSQTDSEKVKATTYHNAQITATDGVAMSAKNKVDLGGVDIAVLSKAPAPDATASSTTQAANEGNNTATSSSKPAANQTPLGLDLAQLRAAAASGKATQFITETAASGMGTAAAMADMPQAASGQLTVNAAEITSTKFKNEYQKTTQSSGVGFNINTKENNSNTSISFNQVDRKESLHEKSDNINNLSADRIDLQGKNKVDLKGVALTGKDSVNIKSEGAINIAAAETESTYHLKDHSTQVGVSAKLGKTSADTQSNVTGELEATASASFNHQTQIVDASSKGHIDSTISGGAINIESSKGDVTWTGVSAQANTLNIKAQNFNSSAYQDSSSYSEQKTGIKANVSAGTDVDRSMATLLKGNGMQTSTVDRQTTQEVGNSVDVKTANLNVANNVTLVGGNYNADALNIKANSVDIKAAKSTLKERTTEAGVSLVADANASLLGNEAGVSFDSMTGKLQTTVQKNTSLAPRTGTGQSNQGKAVSDELLSSKVGLNITSKTTTTTSETYENANIQTKNLTIDTQAAAGSNKGDGYVDIGGANIQAAGKGSSINITTGEVRTTKYVDKTETITHENSTFVGLASEGHSAVADAANHSKTLADKAKEGMTIDPKLAALQAAADAANLATNDLAGGSVSATIRNSDTQTRSVATAENINYISAENINIKTTQGNLNLHGVEFNAPPSQADAGSTARPQNITLDAAKDLNISAAKSTYLETSTNLSNNVSLSASASVSADGTGVGMDAGYNGSIEQNRLATTSYSNASVKADNVTLKAQNLNLTGANVAGGNVNVDVAKNITITSVQDTQQQSTTRGNWGGSAGLNTTTIASGSGQGGGGSSHDNFAMTQTQSGITAENNLNLKAGGDLTMTGAQIASSGTGTVTIAGNLSANKLNDFHEKAGIFAGGSVGVNQGGANVGINLEIVDQIHNATTQNSTISGVKLQAGGKMQGDNLQANGQLQTQTITVTKDEKIAGIFANATLSHTSNHHATGPPEAASTAKPVTSPKPKANHDEPVIARKTGSGASPPETPKPNASGHASGTAAPQKPHTDAPVGASRTGQADTTPNTQKTNTSDGSANSVTAQKPKANSDGPVVHKDTEVASATPATSKSTDGSANPVTSQKPKADSDAPIVHKGPEVAEATSSTPKTNSSDNPPKKYDGAVVVVTRDQNGEIDSVSQNAANDIKRSYPETVIVTAKKDGSGVEGDTHQLAHLKGNVRIDLVGHGGDLKAQGADQVATMVKVVADQIDKNPHETNVKRVEIVACGSCTKDGEKTFGQQVTEKIGRTGLEVAEHDSPIQVNANGTRTALRDADHPEPKKLISTLTESGVVEIRTRNKRDEETAEVLDPERALPKSKNLLTQGTGAVGTSSSDGSNKRKAPPASPKSDDGQTSGYTESTTSSDTKSSKSIKKAKSAETPEEKKQSETDSEKMTIGSIAKQLPTQSSGTKSGSAAGSSQSSPSDILESDARRRAVRGAYILSNYQINTESISDSTRRNMLFITVPVTKKETDGSSKTVNHNFFVLSAGMNVVGQDKSYAHVTSSVIGDIPATATSGHTEPIMATLLKTGLIGQFLNLPSAPAVAPAVIYTGNSPCKNKQCASMPLSSFSASSSSTPVYFTKDYNEKDSQPISLRQIMNSYQTERDILKGTNNSKATPDPTRLRRDSVDYFINSDALRRNTLGKKPINEIDLRTFQGTIKTNPDVTKSKSASESDEKKDSGIDDKGAKGAKSKSKSTSVLMDTK